MDREEEEGGQARGKYSGKSRYEKERVRGGRMREWEVSSEVWPQSSAESAEGGIGGAQGHERTGQSNRRLG